MDSTETAKVLEKDSTQLPPKRKSRRGFAGMDPALVRSLASRGGKAAHEQGTAHEFTQAEAREAGRKGGLAAHKPREPRS